MIAGNPSTGRTITTLAIALLLLVLVSAAFVAWRKRTNPEQEPPLHPSTVIVDHVHHQAPPKG
jgi:LPXTG-motif cell wall-anchored protein